jgi:hypothetical protein
MSTEQSAIWLRSSADASTKDILGNTSSSSAFARVRPTRSAEISEAMMRPFGPTRSNAPKAIRPSPVPTPMRVSPSRIRALSSTRSRIGSKCSRAFPRCSKSSPSRRWSTHAAHLSSSRSTLIIHSPPKRSTQAAPGSVKRPSRTRAALGPCLERATLRKTPTRSFRRHTV